MKTYVPPGKIKALAKENSVKVQVKTPTREDPRFSKLSNEELSKVIKLTKQRLYKLQKQDEYKNIEPVFTVRETLEEYKIRSIYNEADSFPDLKRRLLNTRSITHFISIHEEWVKDQEKKNLYYDNRENDSYEYSLEAGGL